jgi:hypothetical protein
MHIKLFNKVTNIFEVEADELTVATGIVMEKGKPEITLVTTPVLLLTKLLPITSTVTFIPLLSTQRIH